MANPEHVAMLKEGVEAWNKWRQEHRDIEVDLYGANLSEENLGEAYLSDADLRAADLKDANLVKANLSGAEFNSAELSSANLIGANLTNANLQHAVLVGTDLSCADLTGCKIFGISAWNVQLEGAIQSNLVIIPGFDPVIQVDNLEVAQFVYLLLNNERIRHVIDTITSKVVLILGRFTEERKAVLDAIREEFRRRD